MKNILLLSILIFITSLLYSQSTVYDQSEDKTVKIKYGQGSNYNNAIIKKLAEGNNENYNNYKIRFKFKEKREIVNTGTYNNLKFSIENPKIKGKYFYKSFEVTDLLMPSKMSFDLAYYINSTKNQTFNFSNKDFRAGKLAEKQVSIPQPAPEKVTYKFEADNIILFYDSYNKSAFDKKIAIIESYYASSEQVKKEMQVYDNIVIDETVLSSLENLEEIFDYKSIAVKSEEFVQTTRRQNFFSQLPISSNDPQDINGDLDLLYEKSIKLKTVCNNIIQKLDIIYYDRGMLMLAKNDVRMAQFYFNKSIEQNRNFAPAHYQIAKINFDNQNYDETINILLEIYKMNPDVETVNKSNSLADLVFIEYIGRGDNLNAQNRFEDALFWFDKANFICRNIAAVNCSADLHRGYETAVIGIFNNLLANVDKSIAENRLHQAEKNLDIAIQYRAENITYLPDNQTIISRHNQIFDSYISNANSYLQNKKFESAVDSYNHASRLCNKYSYITCTDELQQGLFDAHTGIYTQKVDDANSQYRAGNLDLAEQNIADANSYQSRYKLNKDSRIDQLVIDIKQTRYNNNIAEGQKQVKYQSYEKALEHYNFAKNLEQNYKIRKNKNLQSYINSAAKSLILQNIDEGEKKVNVNDLTSARQFLQKAVDLKKQYGLIDNEVNTAIENLNGKIFKQQCLNYRAEYDTYYQKAINFIFEKNYIKADLFLADAINVANSHTECMIDASNADYKKQEIEDAVTFQKKVNEIEIAYGRSQYQQVIDKYLDATKFYEEKRISLKYSIEFAEMIDYIKSKSNEFMNYSTNYYTKKGELDKALTLLNILKSNFYNKKYTKHNQKLLATKLAIRDYENNPSLNPKVKVIEYTNNERWFKYLKRQYKKQWRRLD